MLGLFCFLIMLVLGGLALHAPASAAEMRCRHALRGPKNESGVQRVKTL